MKESEAVRVVTMLAAYFPTTTIGEETQALWAHELTEFEWVDTVEAAEILGREDMRFPSLAQLLAISRGCRNARVDKALQLKAVNISQEPGCTLDEYLAMNPEERGRIRKLGWWGEAIARLDEEPVT
jgi:hypothetical protein